MRLSFKFYSSPTSRNAKCALQQFFKDQGCFVMEDGSRTLFDLAGKTLSFLRRCLFRVLAYGPLPHHIAFILDGNRRFARKNNLETPMGYQFGFLALMSMLKYCCEIGVKYMTIFAFGIDNFARQPDEVQTLMDLMHEKINVLLEEESLVKHYGVKVDFMGNLKLVPETIRIAAEKATKATAHNNQRVLLVCIAYSSTDEILNAVQGLYEEKHLMIQEVVKKYASVDNNSHEICGGNCSEENLVLLADLERHVYFGKYPDPDILIRTSGESRLSNFLLWQTTFCHLSNPRALWPEISIWNLVWVILQYQRVQPYLREEKKKMMMKKKKKKKCL